MSFPVRADANGRRVQEDEEPQAMAETDVAPMVEDVHAGNGIDASEPGAALAPDSPVADLLGSYDVPAVAEVVVAEEVVPAVPAVAEIEVAVEEEVEEEVEIEVEESVEVDDDDLQGLDDDVYAEGDLGLDDDEWGDADSNDK